MSLARKNQPGFKVCSWVLVLLFVVSLFGADLAYFGQVQAAPGLQLPEPSAMIKLSTPCSYPGLVGLKLDPKNPLNIQFLVNPSDKKTVTKEEAATLIRYFLAGLAINEDDLWVNLSPYEADQMIPEYLAITDLGRDMLA
jgi:hypothetical protein